MLLVIISIILFLIIICFMPKRLSLIEMYTTSLFSIVFQILTDIFFEFKYGFYGYFEKGVDFQTLVIIFGVYPSVTIIFLNFFPLQRRYLIKISYIIGWSLFATFYEWISVIANVFYYEQWELWNSALLYPFIYSLVLLNFFFVRKLLRKYNSPIG